MIRIGRSQPAVAPNSPVWIAWSAAPTEPLRSRSHFAVPVPQAPSRIAWSVAAVAVAVPNSGVAGIPIGIPYAVYRTRSFIAPPEVTNATTSCRQFWHHTGNRLRRSSSVPSPAVPFQSAFAECCAEVALSFPPSLPQ